MQVVKRDGNPVEFDSNRIFNAVKAAALAAQSEITDDEIWEIVNEVPIWDKISVEEIQNEVEEILMDYGFNHLAKEYILYRHDRAILRASQDTLTQQVKSKLAADNVANQNANVDERSFGGRIGEASRVVTKDFALKYCMSEMARNNHINNEIYIHDLDSYAVGCHNCLTLPIDELLANGFVTRQADIRPAGSINTAFQLVAVLFQLQSLQMFGGVAASHLDWSMVPYVQKSFWKHFKTGCTYINTNVKWDDSWAKLSLEQFKDQLLDCCNILDPIYDVWKYAMAQTQKELDQAVEGFYHNLNTLQSRSGNQLPFSSINYGTCTSLEGRMVIESLLNGSLRGIGKYHKTSIFPCGIFQLGKGINRKPGDPNYDLYQLALKSTSKRLYPNYANIDWSGNAGYDKNDPNTYFATMGCRTANGYDINGFGQRKDGRGNICPVTIILPTLAMKANRDVNQFMTLLETKIGEAKDMLIERFEWICSQSPASAKFMYENNTMAGYIPDEGIRSALKHGTLAVGQLGLAETLRLLIGVDHTTKQGIELAKRIESLFASKCAEYKEKYKLNFGVYYSPAENLCHTALLQFRKQYGVIPGVSDREYFTNSMHVSVWHKCTPFEKIDIESQLTGYSSAGCITYVELPSTVNKNLKVLETIVNYAMDKDIPYFAVNIPVDDCRTCGASGEFGDTCPACGSNSIERLRRVTGYLSSDYHNFNPGKLQETLDRVKHIDK